MSDIESELEAKLVEHEAGVADLIAAYESAEGPYFAAIAASTPVTHGTVASNSSAWVPHADMG